MANILIVGADQGIGYYLVERLLEVGNSVTVLDRQTEHVEMLKERYPEGLPRSLDGSWRLCSGLPAHLV